MKNIACLFLILLLCGCAAKNTTTVQKVTPPPPPPQQYSLVAMDATQSFATDPGMQAVDAILLYVPWSQIEPAEGSFDFGPLTSQINFWAKYGKKVVLIIELNSETGTNTAMPSWVKTMVGLTIVKNCSDGGFAYSGMPVVYEPVYVAAVNQMLSGLVPYLNTQAAHILYWRLGLARGGENNPPCYTQWPGWSNQLWLHYLFNMGTTIAGLHSKAQVAQAVSDTTGDSMQSYADWNQFGFMSGFQSLAASDLVSPGGSSDWIEGNDKYPNEPHYAQEAVKPALGDLAKFIPVALQNHVQALEMRIEDSVNIACDPKNPNYAEWGEKYRAALQRTCK